MVSGPVYSPHPEIHTQAEQYGAYEVLRQLWSVKGIRELLDP